MWLDSGGCGGGDVVIVVVCVPGVEFKDSMIVIWAENGTVVVVVR